MRVLVSFMPMPFGTYKRTEKTLLDFGQAKGKTSIYYKNVVH